MATLVNLWSRIKYSRFYQKYRTIRAFRAYQLELDFYKSVLGVHNQLIYDVGASIGEKTRFFTRLASKVVIFEPDQDKLVPLNLRYSGNSRVTIVNCALSSTETTSIYYKMRNSGYNTLSDKHIRTVVANRGILNGETVKRTMVKTNTLEHFINIYGILDYIKIDVEGLEKEVISGLKHPVKMISFEANLPEFGQETLDILKYLNELSLGRYQYNYSIDKKLELADYVRYNTLLTIFKMIPEGSIEIYCRYFEPSPSITR